MHIVRNKVDLNNSLKSSKKDRKKIGLVPTMGSLHEGHLSLIKAAFKSCNEVWVTIFINPTQFNDPKDFESYPKDFENDIKKINSISCNINVFIPESVNEIYQDNTNVDEFELGFINTVLEGISRPGHFDGVATIINKLFEIFRPQVVFFGEKDFQQLKIIEEFIKLKKLKIKLISCPSVRDKNGMSLSSRYNKFNNKQKNKFNKIAGVLNKAVNSIKESQINESLNLLKKEIKKIGIKKIDYIEIRENKNLKTTKVKKNARLFIAFYIDDIRIIDNFELS